MIVDGADLQKFSVVYSDSKQSSAKKRKSQNDGTLVVTRNPTTNSSSSSAKAAGYTLSLYDESEKRILKETVCDLKSYSHKSEITLKSYEIQLDSCVTMIATGKENSISAVTAPSAASVPIVQPMALQGRSRHSTPVLSTKLIFPAFRPPSKIVRSNDDAAAICTTRHIGALTYSSSTSSLSSSTAAMYSVGNKTNSNNNEEDTRKKKSDSIPTVRMCYDDSRRLTILSKTFSSHAEYADQYAAAVVEEIGLGLNSSVRSAERLVRRVLNIAETPSYTSSSRPPSVESVCDKLRSAGVPFSIHVEAILSVRDANGDKIPFVNGRKGKKSVGSYDDDDNDGDGGGGAEGDRLHKVYLKLPFAIKDCPRNAAETYAKGDLWLLWRPDADVRRALLAEGGAVYSGSSFAQSRADFVQHRATKGYPLPFFNGYFFTDVWLVRSAWHAVTDKGLLEVTDLMGRATVPSFIGSPPHGRATGAVDAKLCALRICNESTNLQSIDLLLSHSQTKSPLQGLSNGLLSSTELRSDIKFGHLMESPVFASITGQVGRRPYIALPVASDKAIGDALHKYSGNFSLNVDQMEVLSRVGTWFAKEPPGGTQDVVLVHGVFGCGKSFLVAVICLFIKELSAVAAAESAAKKGLQSSSSSISRRPICDVTVSSKILVSSNTNVAVDRVMTLLAAFDKEQANKSSSGGGGGTIDTSIKMARVGCAQKIDKRLRQYIVLMTENRLHAQKELSRLLASNSSNRTGNGPCIDDPLRTLFEETKKESFNERQKELLKDAHVVGVTCASAANVRLLPLRFPVLILDEASQMTEALSLLPLAISGACRLLLVGDPRQLPPTLAHSTPLAGSQQLSRTLFDRLLSLGYQCTMLRTQYRCHPLISNICSQLFYDNKLVNGVEAIHRPTLIPFLPTIAAIYSCSDEEKVGDSYANREEAAIIRDFVLLLLKNRVNESNAAAAAAAITSSATTSRGLSIGVVCLYKSQVRLIQNLLADVSLDADVDILCSTVDAFQGSEKSLIIISTCRSNISNQNEFITNAARVNVAISRARNNLLIVGNIDVLQKIDLWGFALKRADKFKSVKELAVHLSKMLSLAVIRAAETCPSFPSVHVESYDAYTKLLHEFKAPLPLFAEEPAGAEEQSPLVAQTSRTRVTANPNHNPEVVWAGVGFAPSPEEPPPLVKRKQPIVFSPSQNSLQT